MDASESTFADVIVGRRFEYMLAQEHWFDGSLSDPYNVLYVSVDGAQVLRFNFDGGVFFWRLAVPELPEAHSGNSYRLVEVKGCGAVRGKLVEGVTFSDLGAGGRQLELSFVGGAAVLLRNVDDSSALAFREDNDT